MKKNRLSCSIALSAFAMSSVALAQDLQAEDQSAAAREDIIVTATRRSQVMTDVPLAISAIGAKNLDIAGVHDIRQLNQLSPSLFVSSSSSEAVGGVARIRGIGTVGDNPGLESSVATFIDGVYRSRSGVAFTELGAVERIEIARGPQGSLFGRNALAGLINVITTAPSFEESGTAELSYGNYDYRRAQLGLTGPINAKIDISAGWRLYQARWLYGRIQRLSRCVEPPVQQSQPLADARPVAVETQRRDDDPSDRRLCQAR